MQQRSLRHEINQKSRSSTTNDSYGLFNYGVEPSILCFSKLVGLCLQDQKAENREVCQKKYSLQIHQAEKRLRHCDESGYEAVQEDSTRQEARSTSIPAGACTRKESSVKDPPPTTVSEFNQQRKMFYQSHAA